MREAVADIPVLRTYFGFSTLANCEDIDVCALDLDSGHSAPLGFRAVEACKETGTASGRAPTRFYLLQVLP